MTVVWPTENALIAIYCDLIIGIFCSIATLLAIIAYFGSFTIRQMHQNLLLLNLLINAMLFSINGSIVYSYAVAMKNSDILSIEWVCRLDGFCKVFCSGMELYTLMCIALERYYAIKKQQPLTLKQIIALLVFGWVELLLLAGLPFWNSFYYYGLSDAKFYCVYPFSDRSQIIVTMTCIIHVVICISVICYCYIGIYRIYRHLRKSRHVTANKKDSYLQSHLFKEDSLRKDEEKEYRVFLTTVLLIGWTLTGWTPMLLMIVYQMISGQPVSPYWDMISGVLATTTICGDSIILLLYDKRWKDSFREIMVGIQKIFKF